jgi:hypothetical protein
MQIQTLIVYVVQLNLTSQPGGGKEHILNHAAPTRLHVGLEPHKVWYLYDCHGNKRRNTVQISAVRQWTTVPSATGQRVRSIVTACSRG